jgi:hypothetical protein
MGKMKWGRDNREKAKGETSGKAEDDPGQAFSEKDRGHEGRLQRPDGGGLRDWAHEAQKAAGSGHDLIY